MTEFNKVFDTTYLDKKKEYLEKYREAMDEAFKEKEELEKAKEYKVITAYENPTKSKEIG